MPWLTDTPDGAVLNLRIVPRAQKNAIQGELGDALKIRLCAPPVEGAANSALIEFLSETFSLPRARIQLLAGATSRNKRVLLAGLAASAIQSQIQAGTHEGKRNS
jgi:uncharacterized protein (TIGR00251 family)